MRAGPGEGCARVGVRFAGDPPRPTGLGGEEELLPRPHLALALRCPVRGRALRRGGLAASLDGFSNFSWEESEPSWEDTQEVAVEGGVTAASNTSSTPTRAPGVGDCFGKGGRLGESGSVKISGVSGFEKCPTLYPCASWEEPSKPWLSVFPRSGLSGTWTRAGTPGGGDA